MAGRYGRERGTQGVRGMMNSCKRGRAPPTPPTPTRGLRETCMLMRLEIKKIEITRSPMEREGVSKELRTSRCIQ